MRSLSRVAAGRHLSLSPPFGVRAAGPRASQAGLVRQIRVGFRLQLRFMSALAFCGLLLAGFLSDIVLADDQPQPAAVESADDASAKKPVAEKPPAEEPSAEKAAAERPAADDNAAAPAAAPETPAEEPAAAEKRLGKFIAIARRSTTSSIAASATRCCATIEKAKSEGRWPVFVFEIHSGKTEIGQASIWPGSFPATNSTEQRQSLICPKP